MRYLISVVLLTALIVGWQGSAFAQASVTGTISDAGGDFVLRWPSDHGVKACIMIPETVIGDTPPWKVNPGTEVTISLYPGGESSECIDLPKPFCDHETAGKKVFRPIVEFSANPHIDLGGNRKDITIAICAQYPHGTPVGEIEALQVARSTGSSLDPWDRVAVPAACNLRCPPGPMASKVGASGYLRQLFARSPFAVSPLFAAPAPEGGLGGGGGSLSPFGIIEP